MENYKNLIWLVDDLVKNHQELKDKGFQTLSLKQRKIIGDIQKIAVSAKRDLVKASKKDLQGLSDV